MGQEVVTAVTDSQGKRLSPYFLQEEGQKRVTEETWKLRS